MCAEVYDLIYRWGSGQRLRTVFCKVEVRGLALYQVEVIGFSTFFESKFRSEVVVRSRDHVIYCLYEGW